MSFVLMGLLSLNELIGKASKLARHVFDISRSRAKQASQAIEQARRLRRLS